MTTQNPDPISQTLLALPWSEVFLLCLVLYLAHWMWKTNPLASIIVGLVAMLTVAPNATALLSSLSLPIAIVAAIWAFTKILPGKR